jgi:hypothetical protein
MMMSSVVEGEAIVHGRCGGGAHWVFNASMHKTRQGIGVGVIGTDRRVGYPPPSVVLLQYTVRIYGLRITVKRLKPTRFQVRKYYIVSTQVKRSDLLVDICTYSMRGRQFSWA